MKNYEEDPLLGVIKKENEEEDSLLGVIKKENEELFLSLYTIRNEVKHLWDFPPLVQYFTSHDLNHSIRVIRYLYDLSCCNKGKPLSIEELYVLLAAAYLHDIGMQCDVPDVQHVCDLYIEKGEEGYTQDQQKKIREKHGELAAAWIEYAFNPNARETDLLRAIKTIPHEFVPAVMNVVRYHTGSDVMKCPKSFETRQGKEGRMLLLSLLLRFADELDIGRDRINIDTVRQFSYPTSNERYWWIHHSTVVKIDRQTGTITFKIVLNQADVNSLGPQMEEEVVEQFRRKNEDLAEELFRQGIHVLISHHPAKTDINPSYEPLPKEIFALLERSLQEPYMPPPSLTPVQRLANEVGAMLEAAGYTIICRRGEGRTLSIVCQLGSDISYQKLCVNCVEGEIVPDDVLRIKQEMKLDRYSEGYVISQVRVSPRARELCKQEPLHIKVFPQEEFYKQLIDFQPYVNLLQDESKNSNVTRYYVPLRCARKYMDEQGHFRHAEHDSLEDYINEWEKERGRNHISILGEFGTGKTWFCRHYAYQLLQQYVADPVRNRIPILISLHDYDQSIDIIKFVTDLLAKDYNMKWKGGYRLIEELNHQGRLLFIFDGFDEMKRAKSQEDSRKAIVLNFQKLDDVVVPNSKIILTSRTEYFRYTEEAQQIMSGEKRDEDIIDLSDFRFDIVYLREFNGDQMYQALYKYLEKDDTKTKKYWQHIQKDENLNKLAHRPALLSIIADVLDEIPAGESMNPAKLYQTWINRLLDKQDREKCTFLNKWERLILLTELAWKMVGDPSHPQLRIHYQDIPELIHNYFRGRIQRTADLPQIELDLRAHSFLVPNDEGYFEFAYKNLAEYFVALKYALELGMAEPEYEDNIPAAELQLLSRVKIINDQVLVDWDDLAKTFGVAPLASEVRELLHYIVTDPDPLWKLLQATAGHGHERIGYTGGNVATLLRLLGFTFKGKEMPRVVMKGADLTEADFSGSNLRGAVLREAILAKARFVATDLSDVADLAGADLTQANFNLAIMDEVNLQGANCTDITVEEGREIRICAFDPYGTKLAYGTWEGEVQLIDPDEFKPIGILGGRDRHLNSVTCLAFSPNGRFLASGGYDSRIKLWEVEEKKILAEYNEPNAHFRFLVVSAGGSHIAASDNGGKIYLFQISSDWREIEEQWRDYSKSGPVRCLAFHPTNPNILLAGEYNGNIKIYDIEKDSRTCRLLGTIPAHSAWVSGMTFVPDNGCLATASWDKALKLWNFDTGKLVRTLYESNQPIRCLAYDPIDKKIFIGENDGRIQMIDIATGHIYSMEDKGHADTVYALVFRPTVPDHLVSVALDASVKMWNVRTGHLIRETKGRIERFHCRNMKMGGAEMTNDERDYFRRRGAIDE